MDSVSFTYVEKGSFRQEYHTYGTVNGHQHFYYYNGIIVSVSHSEGDYLEADTVILEYLNRENEKTELKNDTAGFLTEIGADMVTITDRNYYLASRIPLDKYRLVTEGTVCMFNNGTENIRATVTGKQS